MIKNTFLLSAICIIILCLLSCGSKEGDTGDLMSLVPADSSIVASINFKAMVDKGYYEKFKKEMMKSDEDGKDFMKFMEKANIDPEKDIHSMVMAMGNVETGQEDFGILVQGSFDNEALLEAIKGEVDVAEEQYGGKALYTNPEDPKQRMAFMADGLMAVASKPFIEKMIDTHAGRARNITENSEMMELINRVNQDVMIWGCGKLPQKMKEEATGGNPMMAAFNDVGAIIFTLNDLDANGGLDINLQALCSTAEGAKSAGEALNGFKMMGAAMAASEPLFGEFLDAITIEPTGDLVAISASIPQELLDKMIDKKNEMAAPDQEPGM